MGGQTAVRNLQEAGRIKQKYAYDSDDSDVNSATLDQYGGASDSEEDYGCDFSPLDRNVLNVPVDVASIASVADSIADSVPDYSNSRLVGGVWRDAGQVVGPNPVNPPLPPDVDGLIILPAYKYDANDTQMKYSIEPEDGARAISEDVARYLRPDQPNQSGGWTPIGQVVQQGQDIVLNGSDSQIMIPKFDIDATGQVNVSYKHDDQTNANNNQSEVIRQTGGAYRTIGDLRRVNRWYPINRGETRVLIPQFRVENGNLQYDRDGNFQVVTIGDGDGEYQLSQQQMNWLRNNMIRNVNEWDNDSNTPVNYINPDEIIYPPAPAEQAAGGGHSIFTRHDSMNDYQNVMNDSDASPFISTEVFQQIMRGGNLSDLQSTAQSSASKNNHYLNDSTSDFVLSSQGPGPEPNVRAGIDTSDVMVSAGNWSNTSDINLGGMSDVGDDVGDDVDEEYGDVYGDNMGNDDEGDNYMPEDDGERYGFSSTSSGMLHTENVSDASPIRLSSDSLNTSDINLVSIHSDF